ncbi:MAG: transporter substrate-binding domain-containing protein [Rhodoferax sp.]|nr:transporter substrate-binding domain-containing protein [Rhodoferax sp.]
MQIAYFDAFAPLSAKSRGRMQGVFIDVLDEVLHRRLGVPTLHAGFPWTRAQDQVQNGGFDAICTVVTEQRLEYCVASSEAVVSVPGRVFVNVDSPKINMLGAARTMEDVRRANARILTYLGNDWAKENLQGFWLYEAMGDYAVAVNMLAEGRADAMIENVHSMQATMKKMPNASRIRMMEHDVYRWTYRLLVGRKSRFVDIVPAFDVAMRQFRGESGYRQILEKYGIRF